MEGSEPKKVGISESLLAGNSLQDPVGGLVVATQASNSCLSKLKEC